MKIEYLDKINGEDSIVRIYDFDSLEVELFYRAVKENVIDRNEILNLSKLNFIKQINCTLTFVVDNSDIGIKTSVESEFICKLTKASYQKMLDLIEPFLTKLNGFNWLYNLDNEIELLFSPNGNW